MSWPDEKYETDPDKNGNFNTRNPILFAVIYKVCVYLLLTIFVSSFIHS